MKIFAATDIHGEAVEIPDCDLVLIAGDFAKGEKLREVVFGKGDLEEAKKEIIESSINVIKTLPEKSILSLGNVEKPCINEILEEISSRGHFGLANNVMEMKGFKILGLKFFMEERWAREAYPNNEDKIQRAITEEKEIKEFLKSNPHADIILSHLPPHKTLDFSTRPELLPKSYPEHCGSKLLLEYIKNNQPKLVITGHIHIPGEVELGKTKVINPGKGKLIEI
jgi:Icc-related predicted phosphoesterase